MEPFARTRKCQRRSRYTISIPIGVAVSRWILVIGAITSYRCWIGSCSNQVVSCANHLVEVRSLVAALPCATDEHSNCIGLSRDKFGQFGNVVSLFLGYPQMSVHRVGEFSNLVSQSINFVSQPLDFDVNRREML